MASPLATAPGTPSNEHGGPDKDSHTSAAVKPATIPPGEEQHRARNLPCNRTHMMGNPRWAQPAIAGRKFWPGGPKQQMLSFPTVTFRLTEGADAAHGSKGSALVHHG